MGNTEYAWWVPGAILEFAFSMSKGWYVLFKRPSVDILEYLYKRGWEWVKKWTFIEGLFFFLKQTLCFFEIIGDIWYNCGGGDGENGGVKLSFGPNSGFQSITRIQTPLDTL